MWLIVRRIAINDEQTNGIIQLMERLRADPAGTTR